MPSNQVNLTFLVFSNLVVFTCAEFVIGVLDELPVISQDPLKQTGEETDTFNISLTHTHITLRKAFTETLGLGSYSVLINTVLCITLK